ncbi:hypothetical protein V565_124850 [Rhizoctonia solani 123E]|uniref:Uncharacterized protein n=1 Tax=Rhizoctonia solani 123E TaxID=1423351 RepID=A0A074RUV9_9AGAM|nr:hypothetical protein V565_124850 [Rhizoctonia solani 123E]
MYSTTTKKRIIHKPKIHYDFHSSVSITGVNWGRHHSSIGVARIVSSVCFRKYCHSDTVLFDRMSGMRSTGDSGHDMSDELGSGEGGLGDTGLRMPSPEMASVKMCTSSRRFLSRPWDQVGDSGVGLSKQSGVGEWHWSGLGLEMVLNVWSGMGSLGEAGRGL